MEKENKSKAVRSIFKNTRIYGGYDKNSLDHENVVISDHHPIQKNNINKLMNIVDTDNLELNLNNEEKQPEETSTEKPVDDNIIKIDNDTIINAFLDIIDNSIIYEKFKDMVVERMKDKVNNREKISFGLMDLYKLHTVEF